MKLATDIGGTFTDLVYLDESSGEIRLAKSLSTPPGFSQGIMDAIGKSALDPASVASIVHGTTVVINALTERTGAKTALVTTRGCRDVLEIGRANRPDIYNLRFRKQPAFVPREYRFEVTERMNYKGEVVTPLEEEDVLAVAAQIDAADCEAVAVCCLHSYANPQHEYRITELLREHLSGRLVSASSEITREWREYERTSTVVLNAYVQPVAASYLETLRKNLDHAQIAAPLDVMKSNGGTANLPMIVSQPIHMIESGPVGGVIGASAIGEAVGQRNLITLDIGGTTAKCSLIEDGDYKVTTDFRIERDAQNAGYPIKIPVVDIVEIGAGGGSIAWIDDGGSLKVGPRSAGASPGPASYGLGGDQPTVTDANLIAGRINPDYFLGGELRLDLDRARSAFDPIARALGLSVDQAALGVVRIANANMINALKLVSVRRGHDPREFALIAFGGGGSMHAAALARELHIDRVIIPVAPGHFSAWGMLMSDSMQDFIQTTLMFSCPDNGPRIEETFANLAGEARDYFAAAGVRPDKVSIVRNLDMRYHGQEHTVKVPVDNGTIDISALNNRFHSLHERAYTFRLDSQVEIVNFHLAGLVSTTKPKLRDVPAVSEAPRPKSNREVDYDEWGRLASVIYERDDLGPGVTVHGPAIIEEPAATTVVFPGMTAGIDRIGNIIMHTEVGR
jgi:N-methylhydantoinase A